jgi:hypothetical protein
MPDTALERNKIVARLCRGDQPQHERTLRRWCFIPRAIPRAAAMFWVAQASGLSFPASRRKPFATTIIVSTTANPHATFPHEIWRDAKLNRRDACSTQNHTGGVLAQTEA